MGVHHAWGRAYKDLYQRFHAMLGEDQRYQNGFDCQGLWVEVNVERDLGFTSKRDIEAYGIDRFVSLCKQRVLTYAARQTEQSIRLGMWMDWNDPDELRRLRDLLASDPGAPATTPGPDGPVTDTAEMLVGRLGMPEIGGSLLHVQQREQRPDLGVPRGVPPAGLALQGPRLDAVVPALRDRPLPDGDERGLPGSRGPRAHRAVPARRPARRGAPRLDDDAVDARGERGRRRPPRAALRAGPPGRRVVLAGPRRPQAGPRRRLQDRGGEDRRRARRVALHRPVRRAARGRRRRSPRAPATSRRPRTSTAWSPGTRSPRTRGPGSSTSPPAAGPRTTSSARRSACRSSARSTRTAATTRASAG